LNITKISRQPKITIEIDPGASQERTKQCTFDFEFVCFFGWFVVVTWCEALFFLEFINLMNRFNVSMEKYGKSDPQRF
jgi:hypothetical protein